MTIPLNETVKIGNVTVTINAEDIAFLTAETAIMVLLALTPLGILPAWAIVLLPIVKADLPLAEVILKDLTNLIESTNLPTAILNLLHQQIASMKAQQADPNSGFPWT